jgi:sugar-specific transcriptional regulator TrmB
MLDTNKLKKVGLSQNEIRVYLTLLRIGASQAGKVSKESQINRTTTYDSLERLIEKGLVNYMISANKKVFSPVAPERLLDQLKEREKAVEEILPELKQLFRQSKEKEESNVYRGRKGIRGILNEILKCKEYVAYGSSGRFLEMMRHDFIAFQKRKRELKIRARVILSEFTKGTELVKVSYTQFRYIPDEFTVPATTFVYGNKIAIMVWSETPMATVITSRQVADSYRKYFELLWEVAKK